MEVGFDKRLTRKQHRAFSLARQAAGRIMRRRIRLYKLTRDAYAKLARREGALAEAAGDLRTLLRFVRRWMRREYRVMPWRAVLYAVAALVYFVNPVDLIPDALVGLGFVDDVAVIGAVAAAIHKDLERFRRWEQQLEGPEPLPELPEHPS